VQRVWCLTVALAGCGRFIDEDADLWPPPDTGSTVERESPEGFEPCPHLVVEAPFPLSSSASGTSDPRIAWNQDSRQFMVVWREDELGPAGELRGNRLAFQRLDDAGQPMGLQHFALETDGTAVQTDVDPAVVAVPGLQHAPFLVTVQRGEFLGIDRILEDSEVVQPQLDPLTRALQTAPDLARELRIPALSSDGERIAVAYLTDDGLVLVSFDLLAGTGPRCVHATETEPPECCDAAPGQPGPAAIGWLPPSAASDRWAAYDAAGPVPWMAVRVQQSRDLVWLSLRPSDDADDPMVDFLPTPDIRGAANFDGGPRIATANSRFAIAVRRGADDAGADRGGHTEAWQVANDGTVACVVEAPALSVGTPAITWAHGRRLAVVGLVARGGGTDVYLVRGDAPATQEERALAVGRPCPAPIEEEQRLTRSGHVVARDPDVVFSGDGFGVVWAQSADVEQAAEVWFAHARCEDDR
jgi:hypothetical protein